MLQFFFIIPGLAAVANLSCLIENLRRDLRFHRLLSIFYFAVGIQNALTALMCWAPTEELVRIFWSLQCHSFFSTAPILVALSSYAAGRPLVNRWTLGVLLLALFADLFSTSVPEWFIIQFQRMNFGYAPILTLKGGVFASTVHVVAILVSLFLLWKPIQWNSFFNRRVFVIAVLTWWAALFSNFLPMSGFSIPPLHPVVDGILSVLFAIYVNRFSAGRPGFLRNLSHALIAGAVGLLGASFLWPFLQQWKSGPWVLSIVSTALGIAAFSLLSWLETRDNSPVPGVRLDLDDFGLSKQELRICELIAEGHSRSFIRLVLNVSDGTLRNHLKNIYAKVLPENTSGSKDQLQRLTVLLGKRKQRENLATDTQRQLEKGP